MVMSKQPSTTAAAPATSDDWDVINDATVARLGTGPMTSTSTDEQDAQHDQDGKTSFIFVPKHGETTPEASADPPVATHDAAIGAGHPTEVRMALQRMAVSPALPGTPPVAPSRSPPAPPAAVFQPPPPNSKLSPNANTPAAPPALVVAAKKAAPTGRDMRCLRDSASISNDEQKLRQLVEKEAEVERARTANELRVQRLRLGDPTADDEELARKLQADEDARARELEARRRENAEQREAEMIVEARRAAEQQRAKSGPRKCDCLGASAGVHRPTCPMNGSK